jgi:hypothetical protein
MKKAGMLLVLVLVFQVSNAQKWKEWFKQRKTQIEYLVNQIGALQVYIGHVQKGYQIAQEGLTTIGGIKNGDFNLHRDFFGALREVSPKIRNSVQVAQIVALQISIIQMVERNLDRIRASDQLSAKELDYIIRVYRRLLEQTADNMGELLTLLTDDQYELSDDERIKRIDKLHEDMKDKYGFTRWFGDQTDLLVANRKKEQADAGIGESLLLDKK